MTKLKIFRFSFLKARCLNKRWDAIENMQPKRNQSDHNFCQFAVKQKNNELKSCFSIRLHAMQNCWMIKIKGTMFGETLWQLLQWEHSTPTTSVPRSIYYAPYSPIPSTCLTMNILPGCFFNISLPKYMEKVCKRNLKNFLFIKKNFQSHQRKRLLIQQKHCKSLQSEFEEISAHQKNPSNTSIC